MANDSPIDSHKHEGHVLEHIVRHSGLVTLHTCDACVTPERLIEMYQRAIREVQDYADFARIRRERDERGNDERL